DVAPAESTVTPVEEEVQPPAEAVAVEEPEAGASDTETSITGGVEVDPATAAGPTTVPGAHGGKGTVTVTVSPETPVTTPPAVTPTPVTSTPPAAETPPPAEAEVPVVTEPAVEVPLLEGP